MNVAPFVESPHDVIKKMLQLVEPKPDEILYDMGSGDGRIIITAAKDFGLRSIGIEIREDLVKRAMAEIRRLNLESKIKVINDDFFNVNISNANIITLYLTTSANEKLRPKLEKELKSGTRVVSHDYEIRGWMPTRVSKDDPPGHTIYLYVFDPVKTPMKNESKTFSLFSYRGRPSFHF
ncbi:MAG: class I SAM-dependent methyltransferase [archaeon]|nr:class I SAM-dependent methyltransferase [archaeon]MCP8320815.1 class I SAM-dependent methyltransferase [archaeon]